ncbi:hypothetical protein MKEN_01201500 [Mycena kentingensis (nom. inval.)]|nr:hypothetical protein MKEN_01201500 [Mycena kentingensis (nom. inval.)]
MAPILLGHHVAERSNDASVLNFKLTQASPGPYTSNATPGTLPFVPTLPWFCLTKLFPFPDQVAVAIGNTRLIYQHPAAESDFDLLRALVPTWDDPDFNWARVDPRLWATMAIIYDRLPERMRVYKIPLADEHLPLLQTIPSTPNLSLVTILELPGCSELSDTSVVGLKQLHSLCALDVSATRISSHGIKVFARTVQWSADEKKGPWNLRILRLRNCKAIDDAILPHLSTFHLLFVLDLRGTRCKPSAFLPTFATSSETERPLYHPTPLTEVVERLRQSSAAIFSCPRDNVFVLHANCLQYIPAPPAQRSAPKLEDACVTFSSTSDQVIISSSAEPSKPAGRKQHPWSRHRRRGRDSDYDRIVEEELAAHAAAQRTAAFYGVGRGFPCAVPAPLTTHTYGYPPEPPSIRSGDGNSDALMLYRPPPPWSVVTDIAPPQQQEKKPTQSAEVAVVSKQKMAQMADYMAQVANKRRKTAPAPVSSASVSIPTVSNNPFRKKTKPPQPPPQPAKPLVPISAIPTPVLPKGVGPKPTITKSTKNKFDWGSWGKK